MKRDLLTVSSVFVFSLGVYGSKPQWLHDEANDTRSVVLTVKSGPSLRHSRRNWLSNPMLPHLPTQCFPASRADNGPDNQGPLAADVCRHRGRPEGRRTQGGDRGRQIPRHRQDHARWLRPARLSQGKSDKSARDVFFYFSGATPAAVRYKNWKTYYTVARAGPAGWLKGPEKWNFPLIQNIKRDPFEQNVSPDDSKSLLYFGGSLAAPSTAYMYDGLAMIPMGQSLWLKELESYIEFPPMQKPSSYNLDQVIAEIKSAKAISPAGE